MKKQFIFICTVYIFLFVSGSIFAVEERTISLGAGAAWRSAEIKKGISEVSNVRPHSVLMLSSAPAASIAGYSAATGLLGNFTALSESALDMSVSFDESDSVLFRDSTGHYRLTVPPNVEAAGRASARAGNGAALFGRSANSGSLVIQPQSRNSLFAPGNRIGDFTIEFWLYPQNMENGEQIFSWVSSKPSNGNYTMQRISCSAFRNRLQWSFVNFFASPREAASHINIEFSGLSPVIPKKWSHHLIRFDASAGLLEYIVDGASEAIAYATSTSRENSEVYMPIAGSDGSFLLGERFSGLIDELKVHRACIGRSSIQKYNPAGGRIETRAVDLGENASSVVRINVRGGRTGAINNHTRNEFRENGRFRFSDDSEMSFFVRAGENPYSLINSRWESFTPGQDIRDINGRYVQIAVDFYPSADGEVSPYLDELRIVFLPGGPPLPPGNLNAVAVDGAVMLRWRHSPAANTSGYLVYYSSVRGELFGSDALLGPSPIDVGIANSFLIEGLKNGTLYYFRVAAYDSLAEGRNRNIGEFSAEVTARPLAGLSP
ncbi:MAG: hypothetical protein FWD40_04725 [Treponema sp.]|nr:hypothetical protein [Treponema sp.]